MKTNEPVNLDVLDIVRQLGIDQSKYSMFIEIQTRSPVTKGNVSVATYPIPEKGANPTT